MPTSPKTISISVPHDDSIMVKMPRDIRDETYRYLVKGSYILYRPPYLVSTARDKAIRDGGNLEIDHVGPNFGILLVSKAINLEAMRVLYTESIFESWLDFGEYRPYTHHANGITAGMMKLKFNIIGLGDRSHLRFFPEARSRAYLKNMEDICRTTIDHFTGTEITRNYIHIIFHPTIELESELTSPLFCSLENLSGFRTVRIDLLPSSFTVETYDPQLAINHNTRVMQAVRARLEPALGPAVLQHFKNPNDFDYYGYLIFHPHRYMAEKLGPEVKPERRETSGKWC